MLSFPCLSGETPDLERKTSTQERQGCCQVPYRAGFQWLERGLLVRRIVVVKISGQCFFAELFAGRRDLSPTDEERVVESRGCALTWRGHERTILNNC